MNKTLMYSLLLIIHFSFHSKAMEAPMSPNALCNTSGSSSSSSSSQTSSASIATELQLSDFHHRLIEEVPGSSSAAQQPAAAGNAQAAIIVPQANNLFNSRGNKIVGCVIAAFIIILATTLSIELTKKTSNGSWPYSCASDDDDMSNSCFSVKIDSCGSCDEVRSHVRCPMSGIKSARNITSKVKQDLEDTCSDNADYCIAQTPCSSSDGYYVCDPDNLAGFIRSVEDQCARHTPKNMLKITNKVKSQKLKVFNKSFLHRKMQAWDKRRNHRSIV
jgi:hypothetical protein